MGRGAGNIKLLSQPTQHRGTRTCVRAHVFYVCGSRWAEPAQHQEHITLSATGATCCPTVCRSFHLQRQPGHGHTFWECKGHWCPRLPKAKDILCALELAEAGKSVAQMLTYRSGSPFRKMYNAPNLH